MKLNRYLIDFSQWEHDVLVSRRNKRKVAPFVRLSDPITCVARQLCVKPDGTPDVKEVSVGVLMEIRRNLGELPNRDVATWVFMPHRQPSESCPKGKKREKPKRVSAPIIYPDFDWYILCLSLGRPFKGSERLDVSQLRMRKSCTSRRSRAKTHRIMVVQASHWIDNWDFTVEEIFSCEYDLQREDVYLHRRAIELTRELALTIVTMPITEINWSFQIETLIKQQRLGPLADTRQSLKHTPDDWEGSYGSSR